MTESDSTVTMPRLEGRRAAVFRHGLRGAAYQIISGLERLLADAIVGDRPLWRNTLGEALVAARHLLILVEQRLPHSRTALTDTEIAAFRSALEEPRRTIVSAMTSLLSVVPMDPEDELLLEDARAIRQSALHLAAGETVVMRAEPLPGSAGRLPSGPHVAAPRPLGAQARILVVDDEAAGRKVLVKLLERLGYEVHAGEHGKRALELVGEHAFDLVITDINMPEMNGFELLAHLKGDDRTRDIPVIVVSGADDLASVVRCIEQGAEDHVTKPFEVLLLQARVRASLEKKRLRDRELAYLGRVAAVTEAARAVEADTYVAGSLAVEADERDELGLLARVFDRMVRGMKAREEELQQRLRQLKREIRHTRELQRISGAAPEERMLSTGRVLAGRYEIIEVIGQGGMGTVYRARDRELGEELAVKSVRADLIGKDPTIVERLKQEMRLTRKISHRNVVRAYDLGEWQGTYYLTMEYVKGVTVQDLLDMQGRLSVASTLAIGAQLADALAVAHQEGVIHRDIKPRNLLVDDEGVLKVMDFGLARLAERTSDLTHGGFVVGTPRYMAPEQLVGGDVDGRSDLYSVGVVLYECLTGRLPVDAATPATLVAKVFEERPRPVTDYAPEVPAALAAIVDQLLAAKPEERPPSARELAERLRLVA
jgi:CheY-like chemotaxis protein